jgi:iron complex outermembrane receptor protein
MVVKLRQLAKIGFWVGAIIFFDLNKVIAQETSTILIPREERASKQTNQAEKTPVSFFRDSKQLRQHNFIEQRTLLPSNLLSQTQPLVRVTQVKLNRTEQGIEIVLATPSGEQLQPTQRIEGNRLIAEIPNAQLQLPNNKPFRAEKPSPGIAQALVVNRDEKTIKIIVTGETAAPLVELFDSDEGLIFGFTSTNSSAQTSPTQAPTPKEIISVTGVQLNPTETGIELILQTPVGLVEQLQPNNISSGNRFIADIPNAQLRLPEDKPFRQLNPVRGISEVTATNLNPTTIRISAIGERAQPQVELFDSDEGLIFGFTPTEGSAQTAPTPAEVVSIARVQLNPTETGFEVILLTPTGVAQQLQVVNVSQGNNFVAEIPNAQINLPDGKPFRSENPAEGVSEVTVTNKDKNTVRVTAVGEEKQPVVELFDSKEGLIFSAVVDGVAQGEEDIELVVTGEQDGYAVPNSSVGTRTDTPLRDVPQSIQVIPRQVIEDQGGNDLNDALRNVSGTSSQNDLPLIRGFESTDNILSDGVRRTSSLRIYDVDVSNVEQVEVLKGPASVLYGNGEPGGTINVTTEQPLSEPRYEFEGTIGNFDYYRPTIDLTGPLNDNKTILYRLNVAYENSGSFVDFINYEQWSLFPVLSFQIGDRTNLTLEGQYQPRWGNDTNEGLPAVGTVLPNPLGEVPRSRFLGEPDNRLNFTNSYIGYVLNHEFGNDWSLRNRFRASFSDYEALEVFPLELAEDNRTIIRNGNRANVNNETYNLQTDVQGEFQTGSLQHQLLVGLELQRNVREQLFESSEASPIDLFEPEYGSVSEVRNFEPFVDENVTNDLIGLYAQDLLSIGEQVKILLGGRFDWVFNDYQDRLADASEYVEDSAFSPRVGIVYQPIEPVSLYASWTRSFSPQFGTDRLGNPFVPIEGEQFEIGVKTELIDRILTATLAAYQITRQNDFVTDPENPDFEIQIGEQRSRGIEFDLTGEPLPGLRLIATYAYTDATITEDTRGFEGNRSANIPEHSGSLWAVYEIQSGSLEGLGIGTGIFIVGERQGDLDNSFELPGYARTDALLYYRRDNWRVQLNIENLFDGNYFRSTANSRNNVFYGEPFTIRGTVSVEF